MQSTPWSRELARRLLDHEAAGAREPMELAKAAEHVWQKLYPPLSELIGMMGFEAVARSALRRARVQVPFLKEANVEAEAGFRVWGLRESLQGVDPEEARRGMETAIAELLGLLASVMGERIVARAVQRMWPEVLPGGAGAGGEEIGR